MDAAEASVPDSALRALAGPDAGVRVHARAYALDARGRASWDANAERPAALDLLLAAVAADLLAGVAIESRRAGSPARRAELRLQAWLAHPLVVAGVVGEAGDASLREIGGTLYLSIDAAPSDAEAIWQRARATAPVLASLAPGIAVRVGLQLVP